MRDARGSAQPPSPCDQPRSTPASTAPAASLTPVARAHRTMPNPIATCETSMGTFKLEIFLDRVPITASNFIDLSQSGFYNGWGLSAPPPLVAPPKTHTGFVL